MAAAKAANKVVAKAADKAVIATTAALKPAKKVLRAKDKKLRIEWIDKIVVVIYNALLRGVKIRLRAQSGYYP